MPNLSKVCCVPGCTESGSMHQVLHGFPNPVKDDERFRTWIYAIRGDIVGLENEYIYKHRRVCHLHFDEKYLCRNNRISNIAIPTRNLPDFRAIQRFTEPRMPLKQIQNLRSQQPQPGPIDQHIEHIPKITSTELMENIEAMHNPSTTKMDIDGPIDQQIENIPKTTSTELMENINAMHATSTTKMNIDDPAVHIVQPQCSTSTDHKNSNKNVSAMINIEGRNRRATCLTKRIKVSNTERELLKKITALKIKECKYRKKSKSLVTSLKMAKKLTDNPALLAVLENLPSTGKVLTMLQLREAKKKEKGRRFELKEKIISLSIFKKSPKAYRFLRKIIVLPAPQTLIKLMQNVMLHPGLNKKVFDQLKQKGEKMKDEEKICVLLFDEMSLQTNISYNEKQDVIKGFVTDGISTKNTFADHALVLMIRGMIKNYKQPVAYTFCSGSTKGHELSTLIKKTIAELQNAGFIVIATVCDQGASNQRAVKNLIEATKMDFLRRGQTPPKNTFFVNGAEVIPLFDPPHLLKGIRNNLLTKNLKFELHGKVCTAKWSHLELLYAENPAYKGIRLMPKLTENHIVPQKIGKMKVKFATQVLSQTVSSNMGYLAEKGILPKECGETADLLLFFDKLFDSVNGSFGKRKSFGKPYLTAVTSHSVHHKLWADSKKVLKSMIFINTNGKEEKVPTIANWLWTIEGVEYLFRKIHNENKISSIWMRHLNQDPLENFFGSIRSHGGQNINPSVSAFESAFAALLVNNLTSSYATGANCEEDFCTTLHAFVAEASTAEPAQTHHELDPKHLIITFTDLTNKNLKVMAALAYVSGYFLKKVKSKVFKGCSECKSKLISSTDNDYIQSREFGRGWLCHPSKELIKIISETQDVVTEVIRDDPCRNQIKLYTKTVLQVNINYNECCCTVHREKLINFLCNLSVRFFLHNYCKDINRIIKGKRDIDDQDDATQIKAKEVFRKSSKKKK